MPRKRSRKVVKEKSREVSAYEDELVRRIEECTLVVNSLEHDPVFRIITKDLILSRDQIDSKWQEEFDPKKLEIMRINKLAAMHVIQLKDKYAEDLKAAQEELYKQQNPDKVVSKDWDTE